ncbi:MAG: c-type heme family protein [Pirellulales bacterium]
MTLSRYRGLLIAAWTVAVAVSLGWNLLQERQGVIDVARDKAEGALEKDLAYSRWTAGHGGVYVEVTETTPPNRYLADIPERDLTTPSGRKLTLVNSAYMARLVATQNLGQDALRSHITSLRPLRADNAADPWEARAIEALQCGQTEVASVETIEDRPYFRLMRPMITKEACLKCHGQQGFKVGDVRGGLGIAVPLAPLFAAARVKTVSIGLGHAFLGLLGVGGVVLGFRRLGHSTRRQVQAEEALKHSEEKYRALFESSPDALALMEGTTFLDCNTAALSLFGCAERHEFLAKQLGDFSPWEQPGGQDSNALLDEYVAAAWRNGIAQFEWVHTRLDGTVFDAEVCLNTLHFQGRKVLQAVIRDITSRRRMEENVRRTMQELERFNRLAVGREQKMIELKNEVNQLLCSLGREEKYRIHPANFAEAAGPRGTEP